MSDPLFRARIYNINMLKDNIVLMLSILTQKLKEYSQKEGVLDIKHNLTELEDLQREVRNIQTRVNNLIRTDTP